MSILTDIAIFQPDYDDDKIGYFVAYVEAQICNHCNFSAYPTEGTKSALDALVVKKVLSLISNENRGNIKSMSIEGFSETYADADNPYTLSDDEKKILTIHYVIHSDYVL